MKFSEFSWHSQVAVLFRDTHETIQLFLKESLALKLLNVIISFLVFFKCVLFFLNERFGWYIKLWGIFIVTNY